MNLRPCRWSFDGSPSWDGFTDGTTWNGFDNVRITPATRHAVVAWLLSDPTAECLSAVADLWSLPVRDGLVSLANGFATTLAEESEASA